MSNKTKIIENFKKKINACFEKDHLLIKIN